MALRLTGLNAKYMNQEMHMKKYDVTALVVHPSSF